MMEERYSMQNNSVLTGTVLLEAYWSTRKKDLLDLVSPFVQYGVAKITSVGNPIDYSHVTKYVRSEFGYTDIPESVIINVFKRDKEHFGKREHKYYLLKPLDTEIERLEQRKTDCLKKIDEVSKTLHEYLLSHCRKTRISSAEQCVNFLEDFFSKFALQVGFETLESEKISLKKDEVNYYIAQYIFEKKSENGIEYNTLLDLTKGYLLKSAIYLQGNNSNIGSASYKNTAFFYDTPILLQLLGYVTEKENETAKNLHSILKRQGAEFYYFEQNEQELSSILTAYQYSLIGKMRSSRTLEGLDAMHYQFEDVSRLKRTVTTILKDRYDIDLYRMPEYKVTDSGMVDISQIDISQKEASNYVRDHTKHYSEENLLSDISSAINIHRIRNGRKSQSIEKCKAIFVTTNTTFTKAFNDFYRFNIGGDRVMPVITAFDLSAIAWVKGGDVDSDIPELQLLTNSYLALQPAPEIMERCRTVLNQLEREGKISEEDAISLRADRVTQRLLWIDYFPSEEEIDSQYIEKLQQKQRERFIGNTEAALTDRFTAKQEKEQNQRIIDAKTKAHKNAAIFKKYMVNIFIIILSIIFAIIALGCAIGLVQSLSSSKPSLFLGMFLIISLLSIGDTLSSHSKVIRKRIEMVGNHIETIVYERKLKEYLEVIEVPTLEK